MRWAWVAVFAFLIGCQTKDTKTPTPLVFDGNTYDLSWSESQQRSRRVSKVEYELQVDISRPGDRFGGELGLRFDLNSTGAPLFLDFHEGELQELLVNGVAVDPASRKRYRLYLPENLLREGANEVRVRYLQDYSKSGQGLHRFQDPEDKQFYLHTQFQPYEANRFMPCFDQPDIRSTLKLKVLAPKGWHVITATRETKKTAVGGAELWDFPVSPPIATYLFSLHAGPYRVFRDRAGDIPLRLFIRPALAKYLDAGEWFRVTKQGMAFFEKYFDVPYPFVKYDQLIVPDFNFGGMENVAAVTYSEWTVSRSPATKQQRRRTAELLLHELAHMWFGDLVTMTWWNDLWLNESFATYMGTLATAEATEYKDAWEAFAGQLKRGAYTQDAMSTTHPIEARVDRVKEIMSIFDGITYNKGASVMKQLSYFMGPENFKAGISKYMKMYSYKNTTLNDFIGTLQGETNQDLKLWSERWLRQSGTDVLNTHWTCEGEKFGGLELKIQPSQGALFRPQSFEVGLYSLKGGKVVAKSKMRADVVRPEGIVLHDVKPCPDFIYPNHGDHGYVAVKIDAKSLRFLTEHLGDIQDVLTRALVWGDLWRMARDTEISLAEYVAIFEKNFPKETDEVILRQVIRSVSGGWDSVLLYWPRDEKALSQRREFISRLENEVLKKLKKSRSGSDDEKFWFDTFNGLAESPAGLEVLRAWYTTGRVSPKFQLDPDRRWGLVSSLVRFGHRDGLKLLQDMKKRDSSDRGQKMFLAIEAVQPSPEVKERIVREMSEEGLKRPLAELRMLSYSLFPPEQSRLKEPYEDLFYDYLEKNKGTEDEFRVSAVLHGLNPLFCEKGATLKLRRALDKTVDLHPGLKKNLLMSIDQDERCQRIRSASGLGGFGTRR